MDFTEHKVMVVFLECRVVSFNVQCASQVSINLVAYSWNLKLTVIIGGGIELSFFIYRKEL